MAKKARMQPQLKACKPRIEQVRGFNSRYQQAVLENLDQIMHYYSSMVYGCRKYFQSYRCSRELSCYVSYVAFGA